jgi:Ankyrin repeats (many copies)
LEELPESLDETYERILKDIRTPNQEYACRLLQCLVAAARPLRVEELAEIIAFDFSAEGIPKLNPGWRWEDQEEAVMSACSSLVVVVRHGDARIVQFSHFSVKEFLMSNRLARSSSEDVSRYHISLESAHTVLAQACLGALLKLDGSVNAENIKSFALAEYASDYWGEHTEFGSVFSCVKDGIECLLDADKPHFATCFSVFEAVHASTRPPGYPTFLPTPIYFASRMGFYSLVEHLITKRPEDVSAVGGPNGTPLHAAAIGGHVDIVLLLLNHIPVDIRSAGRDRTPLLTVAVDGHVEIGRHLINRGADVNAQDYQGWTPLHLAASFGRVEFVRLLLDHGADPHARDNEGTTPSEDVPIRRQQEILHLLSEYGSRKEEE